MKVIEIDKATKPLGDYARKIDREGILIVEDGTPVAALTPLASADLESVQLAMNPKFWELIKRSRESARTKGAVSHEELLAKHADERAALAHVLPTADDFSAALDVLEESMKPNQRKLLVAHYRSPNRTSTAAKLAKAVGYKSWSGANLQYGALAKRVGDVLSFHPDPDYEIAVMATWKRRQSPGGQLKLTLRPQVAKALEKLKWV